MLQGVPLLANNYTIGKRYPHRAALHIMRVNARSIRESTDMRSTRF